MFIFSDISNGRRVAKFINESVIYTFSYSGYFTTVASLCIAATVSSSFGAKTIIDRHVSCVVFQYQECDCTCE